MSSTSRLLEPAGPEEAESPLEVGVDRQSQLKWLTLFRVALVTILLGATVAFNLSDEGTQTPDRLYVFLYYLCTSVYILSFFHAVLIRAARTERQLVAMIVLQLTGDVLFAAALVLATGGTESAFTFFFSLVIIGGAIVLFRPGALFLATESALLFAAIGLIEMDVIPYRDLLEELRIPLLGEAGHLSPVEVIDRVYRIIYNISVNSLAFFGVGLLASWLSEELRRSATTVQEQRESLAELRAIHQHIVNSLPTGVVTIDRERKIRLFNPAAQEITGLEADLVHGQDAVEVFPMLDGVLGDATIPTTVARDETLGRFGPRRVYLGWSVSPLRDAQERMVGHTFMFQDITRVREMERQMNRREQMAAIGELAAGIAHEIRNPLAAISGSIQLLSVSAPLEKDEQQLLNIVQRETETLNRWITHFLDFSKPRPFEPLRTDLTTLVDEALQLFRHEVAPKGIVVEQVNDPSGEPVMAICDAARIKQVLWNLLQNAAQSMPDGGRVEVCVRSGAAGSLPHAEIAVADRGEGIAPDELDKIFQPFHTTKPKGTGLGLAIVHRIIEDHGGRIAVESEVGKGSTFRVLLPLARPV